MATKKNAQMFICGPDVIKAATGHDANLLVVDGPSNGRRFTDAALERVRGAEGLDAAGHLVVPASQVAV